MTDLMNALDELKRQGKTNEEIVALLIAGFRKCLDTPRQTD